MKYVNHLLLIEKLLWLITDEECTSLTKKNNKAKIGPYLSNCKGNIISQWKRLMAKKKERITDLFN